MRKIIDTFIYVSAALAITLVLTGPSVTRAKPSIRKATKDLGFRDVIKCKFTRRGWKHTIKLTVSYYTRPIECIRKGGVKGHPKIKKVTTGYVEYVRRGRRFHYHSFFPWGTTYKGLPNPTNSTVVKILKANKFKLFRSYLLGYMVTPPSRIRIAKKPDWSWSSPTSLSVTFTCNYRRKRGGYEIYDIEHTLIVHLKRATIKSPWEFVSTSTARTRADREKTLKKVTLSPEEYNKLKSMKQKAEDSQASSHLASLPKVTVPNFKSGQELVLYTYNMLRTTKNPKVLEAYLRQVYSPWHFVKGSKVVMHQRAEEDMKKNIKWALMGTSKFKDQYCAIPLVKERNVFYNKQKSTWTRITYTTGPGKYVEGKLVPSTYKLSTLSVGMLRGSALAQFNSYSTDKCQKPLTAAQKALRVKKASGRGYWKIGDKVWCAFKKRRRYYQGVIANIRGNNIFIKYADGDKEWTTAKFLKAR